jgi:hypothetical protein
VVKAVQETTRRVLVAPNQNALEQNKRSVAVCAAPQLQAR